MIDQHHLDHCLQETCSYWSSCPLYTHSSRNFPHKTCENISTIKNTIVVWFQTCWPAYKWVALTLLPIGVPFTQFFLVNKTFNALNWKHYQPRRSTYKIEIQEPIYIVIHYIHEISEKTQQPHFKGQLLCPVPAKAKQMLQEWLWS